MAVTTADITNRALQLLGSRTTLTSAELAAGSTNEAIQSNLVFTAIRDWCLGLTNWNFARKTIVLSLLKTKDVSNPWTITSPAPPWKFEYAYPDDALIIRYITNSDVNVDTATFVGEPKRFASTYDIIGGTSLRVILTNEVGAIGIYTAQLIDPSFWPWYFERLMVSSLAKALSLALTGDKELLKFVDSLFKEDLTIGLQSNRMEGLIYDDTTPEWTQALGINYPYNRDQGRRPIVKSKGDSNDD